MLSGLDSWLPVLITFHLCAAGFNLTATLAKLVAFLDLALTCERLLLLQLLSYLHQIYGNPQVLRAFLRH